MLWWSNRAFIRHLENEITYFRVQYERERTRAEHAVEELLRLRVPSIAPLTRPSALPTAPVVRDEAADALATLMGDPEFTQAGQS